MFELHTVLFDVLNSQSLQRQAAADEKFSDVRASAPLDTMQHSTASSHKIRLIEFAYNGHVGCYCNLPRATLSWIILYNVTGCGDLFENILFVQMALD